MTAQPGLQADRLVGRIEKAWDDLGDSYSGLSPAELAQPGANGEWSIKDVLAHITVWEEEALKYLPTVVRGGRPPRYAAQGGIDAFNARMVDARRQLSLDAVLGQMEETHRKLIEYVRETLASDLADRSRFTRRLRLDTYGHYRIHGDDIRARRSSRPPNL